MRTTWADAVIIQRSGVDNAATGPAGRDCGQRGGDRASRVASTIIASLLYPASLELLHSNRVDGAKPVGAKGSDLANGASARAAFGGLVHALQDFYAHSNWVEDNIAVGQLDRLAPLLMPKCEPAAFPPGLHTGYFSMDYSSQFPLEGCPPGGPPPGFAECHSTLNKDGWDTPRGITPVPAANMNNFDLASRLATRATLDLYWQVRGMVADKYGECAATNLFQADHHNPCW